MSAPPIALELTLEDGRTAFEPGARLTGVAAWSAPVAPRGMELRLSWAMQGRGGRDFKIADTISLPAPAAAERRPFILTLPAGPYSFRGRLVTLTWTLELVALPGEEKARVDLVCAPGGKTIDLRATSQERQ
jgi:hypothetical protein